LLQDWDDGAGHGLGEAFRALLTAAFVPPWIVVLVQWGILHIYLSRQRDPAGALPR
jgi:hypothetical protein